MNIVRKSNIEFMDEHLARAEELEAIGKRYLADKIKNCVPWWRCKQRICPTCGPRFAALHALKVMHAVNQMNWPHTYMLTFRTRHLGDLKETLEDFRANLSKLRSRKYWKMKVAAGAGAVELKLTEDRRAWNVHCHFVLDVLDPVFDVERVDGYWKRYTLGRGSFIRQTGNRVVMENLTALASYNAKADSWCPPPGALHPDELRTLLKAMKFKRVPIIFPSGPNVKKINPEDFDLVRDIRPVPWHCPSGCETVLPG